MEQTLSIKLNPLLKSSYVNLPRPFSSKQLFPITVVKLVKSSSNHFLGFTGGVSQDGFIEMSPLLAKTMQLEAHELVKVNLLSEAPPLIDFVTLDPLTNDDFVKMNRNTDFIEANLLDQLSVIYPGQVTPIVLPNNEVAFLYAKLSVEHPFYLLSQECEVVISFKEREEETVEKESKSIRATMEMHEIPFVITVNEDALDCLATVSFNLPSSRGDLIKLLLSRVDLKTANEMITKELEFNKNDENKLCLTARCVTNFSLPKGTVCVYGNFVVLNSLLRKGDSIETTLSKIDLNLANSEKYKRVLKNDCLLKVSKKEALMEIFTLVERDVLILNLNCLFQLKSNFCSALCSNTGNLEVLYRTSYRAHKNLQFLILTKDNINCISYEICDSLSQTYKQIKHERQHILKPDFSLLPEIKFFFPHLLLFPFGEVTHIYGPIGNKQLLLLKEILSTYSVFDFTREPQLSSTDSFVLLKSRLKSFFLNNLESNIVINQLNSVKSDNPTLKQFAADLHATLKKYVKKAIKKGSKIFFVSESFTPVDLSNINSLSSCLNRNEDDCSQN